MFRKDFNIDNLERYHRKKFELISKIQDLRDLIKTIREEKRCLIQVVGIEFNIDEFDDCYSDCETGFSEHIVKALEDIQAECIKKFESIKIGD